MALGCALRLALVSTLVALASTATAGGVAPFVGSAYYSKFKRMQHVTGDLADKATLALVLEAKVFRGELILFAFNSAWLDWGVNMAAQLHHVGFDHFVAFTFGAAECESLRAHVPHASCLWSSFPGGSESPGWEGPEAAGTQGLWIKRYFACTQLASLQVNVLMLDLDTIVFRDPYVDLKAPPLQGVKLIHLKEGFANGGMFYLQNVQASSPALWVHKHVLWKANLIVAVEHTDHQHLGTFMDQALLNDNLNAAACNSSTLDMPSVYVTGDKAWGHPFWQTRSEVFNKSAGELSRREEGKPWYCDWLRSNDTYAYEEGMSRHECVQPCGERCTLAWDKYRREQLTGKRLEFLELRIPLDAVPAPTLPREMDLFAAAPPWVFGLCDAAHTGWHYAALIHLVACSADWADDHPWTHVGRRALMVAAGAWRREAVIQPVPPMLAVSPTLVVSADLQTKADVTRLISRILAAAASAGRLPVLPGFDCSLPWIAKSDSARDGVFDKNVIKHRGVCYPAPGGVNCNHAHVIGGYEFHVLHENAHDVDVLELRSFDDAQPAGSDGDATSRLARLRTACPAYF